MFSQANWQTRNTKMPKVRPELIWLDKRSHPCNLECLLAVAIALAFKKYANEFLKKINIPSFSCFD